MSTPAPGPTTRCRIACLLAVLVCCQWSWAGGDEELTKEEQVLVDLTNAERRRNGLPRLTTHPQLMKAARAYAANMAKQNKLDHKLDGKDMTDRLKDVEYAFSEAGENIAHKPRTPRDVIKKWLESPLNKGNILNEDFTDLGIGIAKNDNGEFFWVQVFGAPLIR